MTCGGTAVTLLSEAGCTPQQIATITGHSLKTVHLILERYLARTRGLAEQAIFNFEKLTANKVCKPIANQHLWCTQQERKNAMAKQ